MNDKFIDQRWGNEISWFLRYRSLRRTGIGNAYFRSSQSRLAQLMDFNEAGVVNLEHFAARLETASLRRFQHKLGVPLGAELKAYFDSGIMSRHREYRSAGHPRSQ
jgi:hypothetical protein